VTRDPVTRDPVPSSVSSESYGCQYYMFNSVGNLLSTPTGPTVAYIEF